MADVIALQMSVNMDITRDCATVPAGVGGAVGVTEPHWFVAVVNNRSEKVSAERLTKIGIENYVPTQKVVRIWKNGRKAKIDRIVIPATIFVHCTEAERKEIVKLPYIFRFMTNKAGAQSGSYGSPIATVSEDEIKQLKFMLGQSDVPVEITKRPYKVGDKVRIIRGSLAGLEGEVFETGSPKSEVTVRLEFFGCAKLKIDTINLEISKN